MLNKPIEFEEEEKETGKEAQREPMKEKRGGDGPDLYSPTGLESLSQNAGNSGSVLKGMISGALYAPILSEAFGGLPSIG